MEILNGKKIELKDVEMKIMERMMDYVMEKRGEREKIVGDK